jgi:uncharacterized protein YecE (DUF72 family)
MTNNCNFLMGCALWGYKGWLGDLFPPGSRAKDFLQLYGQRFATVEGNTTFYSVPDAKTIQRWASETPFGFQFCPKFPKALTHHGALQPHIPGAIAFLNQMRGLGDRLGVIFAQLPPSYSPASLSDLELFLTALPRHDQPFAVEVRHRDWFQPPHRDRLNELLTRLEVGRVLLDTRPIYDVPDDPQLHFERKKPQVPVDFSLTASFSVVRYTSHPDWETNLPFLHDWQTKLDEWLTLGHRVYFFVHCPLEERSPINARHFQAFLERHRTPVPPLPWNSLDEQPPTQLSLL